MLNLLLVNPGNSRKMYQETASERGIEPPFWAGLLASFIRQHGYQVQILDADADNLSPESTAEKVAECSPLLTAIIVQGVNPSASSTPKMSAVSDLLRLLKAGVPHIKTILIGLHPSALPERTLREEEVDYICQGEGFYTILGLLQGKPLAEIGGLWHIFDGGTHWLHVPLLSSQELPPVAWDLLDMTKYRAHNWHCLDDIDHRSPYGIIYTSLGCPYDCHYCQIKQLYSGKPGIRHREPEEVIKEIDLLVNKYGVKHIKFMDELFTINQKQVASICDPIIRQDYDLNIWVYGRVDRVTKPMLEKMKQAGINWICYGFESGSEKVRQGVHKQYKQDQIKQTVEMTKDAGIHIIANFIFGLPDDDLESMQATLDMAKGYNFEYANFYTCMAYPGSQLYEVALRQGVHLPETWDGYSQLGYETMPLPTKYLTSQEVLAFRDKAFQEYFGRSEYLEMIRSEFSDKAAEQIRKMLKHPLKRRLLGD